MDIKFLGSIDGTYQGTYNDISFDSQNDIKLVTGRDYVKQKVVKCLLTKLGEDVNFPNYGSILEYLLFEDINDPIIQNTIVETILGALTYIEEQETSTALDEKISSVDHIEFVADPDNHTVYITIVVTLQSGESLVIIISS